jgi:uncharacterized membrane protein YeaQ/YmgE (transglycosylase-associated protein family)
MSIFWMLLIGIAVGALARPLVLGRPGGILMTILLGMGGAVLTGYVGRALGWFPVPVTGPGVILTVLGAICAIVVFGLTAHRRLDESSQAR